MPRAFLAVQRSSTAGPRLPGLLGLQAALHTGNAFLCSLMPTATGTRKVPAEMLRSGRAPKDQSEQLILHRFLAIRVIQAFKDEPRPPPASSKSTAWLPNTRWMIHRMWGCFASPSTSMWSTTMTGGKGILEILSQAVDQLGARPALNGAVPLRGVDLQ